MNYSTSLLWKASPLFFCHIWKILKNLTVFVWVLLCAVMLRKDFLNHPLLQNLFISSV